MQPSALAWQAHLEYPSRAIQVHGPAEATDPLLACLSGTAEELSARALAVCLAALAAKACMTGAASCRPGMWALCVRCWAIR